jgi:hypothetical protein
MSETDPYAAPEIEEANAEVTAAAPAAPVEEPKPAVEEAVPEGSIKEVLAWVGSDTDKAKRALDAENSSDDPRKTLVKSLTELLD